jgi:hypothetical protein
MCVMFYFFIFAHCLAERQSTVFTDLVFPSQKARGPGFFFFFFGDLRFYEKCIFKIIELPFLENKRYMIYMFRKKGKNEI